jgi:hypothetical protein
MTARADGMAFFPGGAAAGGARLLPRAHVRCSHAREGASSQRSHGSLAGRARGRAEEQGQAATGALRVQRPQHGAAQPVQQRLRGSVSHPDCARH